jgi:hypothetical protein
MILVSNLSFYDGGVTSFLAGEVINIEEICGVSFRPIEEDVQHTSHTRSVLLALLS